MGVLYDYFAAPSDESAAATIDLLGGPGSAGPAYPTVADTGIEPVVQMGTLEALLTGRSYDVVAGRPADPVAIRDGGERVGAIRPSWQSCCGSSPGWPG